MSHFILFLGFLWFVSIEREKKKRFEFSWKKKEFPWKAQECRKSPKKPPVGAGVRRKEDTGPSRPDDQDDEMMIIVGDYSMIMIFPFLDLGVSSPPRSANWGDNPVHLEGGSRDHRCG
jgi:hypothetical protein